MKTNYFEEQPGKQSSMRLMCFISLLAGIGSAFWTLSILTVPDIAFNVVMVGFYLTALFVLGAFAPKAIQKIFEKAIDKKL